MNLILIGLTLTATGDAEPPVPYNHGVALKGKNMNDGVKILLERMKTNPEEFAISEGFIGKWDSLIREYETVLAPDDVKAFKEARNILLQQQFTERVMEELVDPKMLTTEEWDAKYNSPKMPYTVNHSGTITSWENREPITLTLTKTVDTPIAGVTQTV